MPNPLTDSFCICSLRSLSISTDVGHDHVVGVRRCRVQRHGAVADHHCVPRRRRGDVALPLAQRRAVRCVDAAPGRFPLRVVCEEAQRGVLGWRGLVVADGWDDGSNVLVRFFFGVGYEASKDECALIRVSVWAPGRFETREVDGRVVARDGVPRCVNMGAVSAVVKRRVGGLAIPMSVLARYSRITVLNTSVGTCSSCESSLT